MTFSINQRRLVFRLLLFLIAGYVYVFFPERLIRILKYNIASGISTLHILWGILIGEMVIVPFPFLNKFIGCGKHFKKHYIPNDSDIKGYDFLTYTRKGNKAAIIIILLWSLLLSFIGILYLKGIFGELEILLIVLFFYLSDQICINIWCPFQSFIMNNKCCNTCRIYNWGHFMMFSPLIFIANFYALSLVIISFVILLQWEYLHYRYPERFIEMSNLALRCDHCKDSICRIKRRHTTKPQYNNSQRIE